MTPLTEKVLLETRLYYESLEPLIYFLAFLVPKEQQICCFLAILLAPNKILSHEIGLLGGLPGKDPKMIQKPQNLTQLCHRQKTDILNFSIFKNRNYNTYRDFRGFEQLSSSIGWRVIASA